MTKFEELALPFEADELEWRVLSSGTNDKGPWARVAAYVTNRAIMERLDKVCGPESWQNRYESGPDGGVVCGLGLRYMHNVEDGKISEWLWKYDGAPNTDIESVKGGLSDSMKRAAVHWGIGRYLYGLTEAWASFNTHGKYNSKISDTWYHWNPPQLPDWALATKPNDRVENGRVSIDELLNANVGLFDDSYIEHMKLNCEGCTTNEEVENLWKSIKSDVFKANQKEIKEGL